MCVCKLDGSYCQVLFIGKLLIQNQSVFLRSVLNEETSPQMVTNGFNSLAR